MHAPVTPKPIRSTLSYGMDFAIASVSFQDYSSVTLPSASFSTFMPDTGM